MGKTSHLCPIEARLDRLETTGISLTDMYVELSAGPAGREILLVDACRNDPEAGGQRSIDTVSRVAADFLRELESGPEGIVVLSSCSDVVDLWLTGPARDLAGYPGVLEFRRHLLTKAAEAYTFCWLVKTAKYPLTLSRGRQSAGAGPAGTAGRFPK